jgi:hypothetical protein
MAKTSQKTPKTAPELERLILLEMRHCAACRSVSAVTVGPAGNAADADWDVSHIYIPGGEVPQTCMDVCRDAVETLRAQYELVTEIETDDL